MSLNQTFFKTPQIYCGEFVYINSAENFEFIQKHFGVQKDLKALDAWGDWEILVLQKVVNKLGSENRHIDHATNEVEHHYKKE